LSEKHPIIVITGSSGAGTTTVRATFEEIFRREGVTCALVEGDAFHRYDRLEMKEKMAEMERQGYARFSRFGPEANLLTPRSPGSQVLRSVEALLSGIGRSQRERTIHLRPKQSGLKISP
jgi:phosphoribulokinase